MTVLERAKAPTPKFFKILRTIGLALATIGGGIIASPVVLPAAIVTVAGYLALAGGVITSVSQLTVEDKGGLPDYTDEPAVKSIWDHAF